MTDDDKALVERLKRFSTRPIEHDAPAMNRVAMDEAAERIEAQAAEIERLREVSEFYAGWGVTNPVYDTVVILDGGKKARAALEQSK